MSKSASSTQFAPIASGTTFSRKRSYFNSLSATRARRLAWLMPGRSSQTPTIIIRLTSLSMRSQAVSTRDMRCIFSDIGFSFQSFFLSGAQDAG